MSQKTTKIVHIQHLDSGHKEELTQEDYDALQPRIKEKYKVTSTKDVTTPPEVAGK